MKKNRILLFIKTPPPTTGATLMNKRVYYSKLLRMELNIRSICISYMQSRTEMGKFQLKKLKIIIWVYIRLLYELLFKRPDLVYLQLSPTGIAFYRDLIYISLIKLFRVKILYHLRGRGIKERVKKKIEKKLYKFAFNKSEVICLSQLLIEDFEEVHTGKIHVVPNGIPDIKFSIKKRQKFEKEINIIFLSNLIKDKGVFDFLNALKILNENNLSFQGLIIGAEADLTQNEISNKILEFGLTDKVTYLGAKYGNEKHKILSKCQVLAFPTKLKHETFGNVNLEGMQHSLAIVSSNLCAIPDIIDDGITGFLVEPDSPEQIAEKLEILINNPEKCVQMGLNGRKKYEREFTLERFETNLLNVIKEAAK